MNLETHGPTYPPASLADVLDSRREDIIHQWLERLKEDLVPGPRPRSSLKDHFDVYLQELAAVLHRATDDGTAEVPERSTEAREHGSQRSSIGFDLPTLVHEYGVLHECILDQVAETGVRISLAEARLLVSSIVTGIAEAVDAYTRQRDETQHQDEAKLQSLLDHSPVSIACTRLPREAEAQHERMAGLFQEAPAIIFVLQGPEHILTLANPRLYEAIGVGREVLGKPLREALPELEDQGFRVLLDNVYRTGEPAVGHEVRVWVYRSGDSPTECFFNFVYAPTRGPDGRVDGVFVHAVEVTELVRERQKAEEALALLDTLLTNAPVGLSFLDRDLRYVRVNQMLADIVGSPIEQVLGQDVDKVVPALASQLTSIRRRVLETGQPVLDQEVTGPSRPRGGEIRHWLVNHSPVRNRAGEVILVASAVLDITERKRAESATEERFRLLLEGTLLSQSLDVHTTLKSLASLVVSHLADYCMVDLLGEDGQLHRLELTAREPERQALIHRSMTSPPHMGDGGLLLPLLESGAPLAVPEVTPAWLDAVARDTEHRALLEALSLKSVLLMPLVARGRKLGIISFAWSRFRPTCTSTDLEVARGVADRAAMALDNARLYQEAQEAIRVREDVVAIVSHDLRTPLNAISLSATSLLKREHVDERTTKTAHRIHAAADRASRMIHDLLDFNQARMTGIPVHREPLELHEHVRKVLREVRLAWPERRITFQASGDGRGEWDGDRLAQVITNLVGNALQHSPEGTPVRVSTRSKGPSVLLEVHNEGHPIPPEVQAGLFEPYRRGPEAGERQGSLGLGLFITRQIVLGHGGTIDVRSTEEEGTTFTVRLPRHPG